MAYTDHGGDKLCTQCGAIVAASKTDVHDAFHATAWQPPVYGGGHFQVFPPPGHTFRINTGQPGGIQA